MIFLLQKLSGMKTKQPRFLANLPIVWLLPAIALGVALWLIYPEYINRGTQITIEFANASGIQVGNTELEYRGVPAGKVKEVTLKKDLQGALVRVRLEGQAKSVARKGAQFWIERPQVDLSGVSGLETLFTGAHINVIPGTGPAEKYFVGLANPPSLNGAGLGRAFFVFSEHVGTLQPHASVLYKGFKVGEVETSQLTGDARGILTRLRVYNRSSSRFKPLKPHRASI
jgi:paraquat-inducible protein B